MKRNHLTPQTRAFTKVGTYGVEAIVGARYEEDYGMAPSEHEYGWKPIWLKISGKAYQYLHLTGLTTEELEAFRKVVNMAVDDAMVIVNDLDAQAVELMETGTTEVPMRALASAPPYFERKIDLHYGVPAVVPPNVHESAEPFGLTDLDAAG